MALNYGVHIELREKDLVEWVNKRVREGNFKPTLVFRDAVKELKRQNDVAHTENPSELHRKINVWHKIADRRGDFIKEKGQMDEFMKFDKKQEQEEKFKVKKKNIVTIEIQGEKDDNSN